VATTYRVSEHWQTGLMTRTQDWLMELQPQMFVEMSEELAKLKGIKNGERVNGFFGPRTGGMHVPLSPSGLNRSTWAASPFTRWAFPGITVG
jgi:anaerobic selenocysteine-containing dehydrogenase